MKFSSFSCQKRVVQYIMSFEIPTIKEAIRGKCTYIVNAFMVVKILYLDLIV